MKWHLPVLALLLLALSTASAYAGGACCSVSGPGSESPTLTVVGASAMNHEIVGGTSYKLEQRALILKVGKPLGNGFILQAQLGMPTGTELTGQAAELSGRSGLIYGAGLGYKPPRRLGPFKFFASLSYSRAIASLDRATSQAVDRYFLISEFQALLLAEMPLAARTSFYTGPRAYSGKNRLTDRKAGNTVNGDQEGNLGWVAGARYNLSDKLALIADAGFGHTKVLGLGAVLSF